MQITEFEQHYDCQIQYQYSFDGKKKNYYPIISNLHLRDVKVSLEEFNSYPRIDFHSSEFYNVEFVTHKIRDLNFQHSNIQHLTLSIDQFNGTLGFSNSSVSVSSLRMSHSPKILAIVECVVIAMNQPNLVGFDDLHTCAIINSSLDYLDIDEFLDQINTSQLLLADIEASIPMHFQLPNYLQSLKLRNISIHAFPGVLDENKLEKLYLEEVEFVTLSDLEQKLNRLNQLEELGMKSTSIKYLSDLNLPNLKMVQVDSNITLDDKLKARLKIAGVKPKRV